jgi:hypothetical protein
LNQFEAGDAKVDSGIVPANSGRFIQQQIRVQLTLPKDRANAVVFLLNLVSFCQVVGISICMPP